MTSRTLCNLLGAGCLSEVERNKFILRVEPRMNIVGPQRMTVDFSFYSVTNDKFID